MITTYDTLASDFSASGGEEAFSAEAMAAAQSGAKRKRMHGVMGLKWHRIVLDEAHTIRNPKTGKHKVGQCSKGWILGGKRGCSFENTDSFRGRGVLLKV